ncbi:MAG: DUF3795 domain-containing protein [Bacillota bacterium]|jgi:hypothetical protein
MVKETEDIIAVCGLNCGECDLYRAPSDPGAMKRVLAWLNKDTQGSVKPEQIRWCGGCLGDRETHWSADCDILMCAVDDKSLKSCSQCDKFVCDRLTKWASKSKRYTQALERLKGLRSSG